MSSKLKSYAFLAVILTTVLAGLVAIVSRHSRGRSRPLTIAVIPKTTATDYWESMHTGVLAAASGHPITILWNAPQSESEYAEQAQMVEDAISKKVSAIVLAPSHESVLASAVRHASAEGISVVIVDSPIAVTPAHYQEYIGSDDARIGELAADRIGFILGGEGEIAIVGVSPTVESSVLRNQAFILKVTKAWPKIKIVDVQYGLSNPRRSQSLTTDLLAAHPHLRALFTSDAFATRGVFAALREAHNAQTVRLVGVAQEIDLLDQVRDGNLDALIVQDPFQMGYSAVQALEDPNGRSRTMQTQVVLATRENLDSASVRRLWSHYQDSGCG